MMTGAGLHKDAPSSNFNRAAYPSWGAFCVDKLCLKRSEIDVVALLYNTKGVCRYGEISATINPGTLTQYNKAKIIAFVLGVRKKLASHFIDIESRQGLGYEMPEYSKVIIDKMFSEACQANEALTPITLPPRFLNLVGIEEKILNLLVGSPFIHSRESIINIIYGKKRPINERVIDVRINMMRSKLDIYGLQIKTVYGLGYFLPYASQQKVRDLLKQWRAASDEVSQPVSDVHRSVDAIIAQAYLAHKPIVA